MVRRITESRVKAYATSVGLVGVPIGILLFSLIFSLGVAELKGNYTANELCGGDVTCYLEMTELCFNEDVFVYPMNGAELVNARPSDQINDFRLYRSWGDGWTRIYLNDTCKSTRCGGKRGVTNNAYSYAFRSGKCYDIRIEVDKPENSTINWQINPEGTWFGKGDIVVMDSNTPICLDCYTDYQLTNPTESELCSVPNVSFINPDNLNNYEFLKEINENKVITKKNYTYTNVTKQSCRTLNETGCTGTVINETLCCSDVIHTIKSYTLYNVTKNVSTWIDATGEDLCLGVNESKILKVKGSLIPETAVDNIICYAGYCFPEYAWWNSSFNFRRNITDNPGIGLPLAINQTNKFLGWNIWVNASAGSNLSIYYNDATDLAVYDFANSKTVSYEIEQIASGKDTTGTYWNETEMAWHYGNSTLAAYDSTVNGNNGTVSGATWTSSGLYNGGYSCDGAGNYIEASTIGNSVDAISFWFKAQEDFVTNGKGVSSMTNGGVDQRLAINTASSGKIRTLLLDSSVRYDFQTNANFAGDTTNWHMYTLVANGTHVLVYINGTLDNSAAFANNGLFVSSGWNYFDVCAVRFDAGGGMVTSQDAAMITDEAYIYTSLLTGLQVAERYNNSQDGRNMILGPQSQQFPDFFATVSGFVRNSALQVISSAKVWLIDPTLDYAGVTGISQTTTNASGYYNFSNLDSSYQDAIYMVVGFDPNNYTQGSDNRFVNISVAD